VASQSPAAPSAATLLSASAQRRAHTLGVAHARSAAKASIQALAAASSALSEAADNVAAYSGEEIRVRCAGGPSPAFLGGAYTEDTGLGSWAGGLRELVGAQLLRAVNTGLVVSRGGEAAAEGAAAAAAAADCGPQPVPLNVLEAAAEAAQRVLGKVLKQETFSCALLCRVATSRTIARVHMLKCTGAAARAIAAAWDASCAYSYAVTALELGVLLPAHATQAAEALASSRASSSGARNARTASATSGSGGDSSPSSAAAAGGQGGGSTASPLPLQPRQQQWQQHFPRPPALSPAALEGIIRKDAAESGLCPSPGTVSASVAAAATGFSVRPWGGASSGSRANDSLPGIATGTFIDLLYAQQQQGDGAATAKLLAASSSGGDAGYSAAAYLAARRSARSMQDGITAEMTPMERALVEQSVEVIAQSMKNIASELIELQAAREDGEEVSTAAAESSTAEGGKGVASEAGAREGMLKEHLAHLTERLTSFMAALDSSFTERGGGAGGSSASSNSNSNSSSSSSMRRRVVVKGALNGRRRSLQPGASLSGGATGSLVDRGEEQAQEMVSRILAPSSTPGTTERGGALGTRRSSSAPRTSFSSSSSLSTSPTAAAYRTAAAAAAAERAREGESVLRKSAAAAAAKPPSKGILRVRTSPRTILSHQHSSSGSFGVTFASTAATTSELGQAPFMAATRPRASPTPTTPTATTNPTSPTAPSPTTAAHASGGSMPLTTPTPSPQALTLPPGESLLGEVLAASAAAAAAAPAPAPAPVPSLSPTEREAPGSRTPLRAALEVPIPPSPWQLAQQRVAAWKRRGATPAAGARLTAQARQRMALSPGGEGSEAPASHHAAAAAAPSPPTTTGGGSSGSGSGAGGFTPAWVLAQQRVAERRRGEDATASAARQASAERVAARQAFEEGVRAAAAAAAAKAAAAAPPLANHPNSAPGSSARAAANGAVGTPAAGGASLGGGGGGVEEEEEARKRHLREEVERGEALLAAQELKEERVLGLKRAAAVAAAEAAAASARKKVERLGGIAASSSSSSSSSSALPSSASSVVGALAEEERGQQQQQQQQWQWQQQGFPGYLPSQSQSPRGGGGTAFLRQLATPPSQIQDTRKRLALSLALPASALADPLGWLQQEGGSVGGSGRYGGGTSRGFGGGGAPPANARRGATPHFAPPGSARVTFNGGSGSGRRDPMVLAAHPGPSTNPHAAIAGASTQTSPAAAAAAAGGVGVGASRRSSSLPRVATQGAASAARLLRPASRAPAGAAAPRRSTSASPPRRQSKASPPHPHLPAWKDPILSAAFAEMDVLASAAGVSLSAFREALNGALAGGGSSGGGSGGSRRKRAAEGPSPFRGKDGGSAHSATLSPPNRRANATSAAAMPATPASLSPREVVLAKLRGGSGAAAGAAAPALQQSHLQVHQQQLRAGSPGRWLPAQPPPTIPASAAAVKVRRMGVGGAAGAAAFVPLVARTTPTSSSSSSSSSTSSPIKRLQAAAALPLPRSPPPIFRGRG
jgi:hypothetical protein